MQLSKAKTASKSITLEAEKLKATVESTLRKCSQLVGSTLGPNGKVVLIERQENLPPFATKDGITVFKSMAFNNATEQIVLEASRDSSAKTNTEAGDGTSSTLILAEAIVRLGFRYLEENKRASAQKIMRELDKYYRDRVAPFIEENSIKITNDNDSDLLLKVATIAANNDYDMAKAVMDCFDIVGHDGNVTITEASGHSGYEVEKTEGFPIARGFEDTCGRFLEEFINDKARYRTVLENPNFVLYNGKLNDINPLLPILEKVGYATDTSLKENQGSEVSPNLVVVAHSFSDSVLAVLANNFKQPNTINVIPLKTVMTHQPNSPYHLLLDLSAFTGASVFDPLTRPLERAEIMDLGLKTMSYFEFYRYKSLVLGEPNEDNIILRVEELEQQKAQEESTLDAELLQERMAVLTGGIARLKVLGSSEAELKEKRHRVEDAVCSVKGALRMGVLPGCGKTLLTLAKLLESDSETPDSVKKILVPAFKTPFMRVLKNGGYNKDEIKEVSNKVLYKEESKSFLEKLGLKNKPVKVDTDFLYTYDALNFKYGNAVDLGVIDSAAAVLTAIKNSLSVSKMLMSLSGIVVFSRDHELERQTARDHMDQQRAIQEAEKQREEEEWSTDF